VPQGCRDVTRRVLDPFATMCEDPEGGTGLECVPNYPPQSEAALRADFARLREQVRVLSGCALLHKLGEYVGGSFVWGG
jgi:hypothetical protein